MSLHIIPQSDYPPKYYVEVCRHDYGEDSGYRIATIELTESMDDAVLGDKLREAVRRDRERS